MIKMNEDTDYVHTHVINYEPTHRVLMEAVNLYRDGGDLIQCRDMVADVVEGNVIAMGLDHSDLTTDVDFIDMVLFEVNEDA